MKIIIGIIIIALLAIGAFVLWNPGAPMTAQQTNNEENPDQTQEARGRVAEGTYNVVPQESEIRWAGKKPLIEGYINSGTIGVSGGTIGVEGDDATGTFTIDMNTLTVSETKAKPGRESTLEGHLKGEAWFNVAAFPNATFEILEVTPRADSDTSFIYDVRGELTMKGQTHEITFPATIYEADGKMRADASFEIDRTKWGLTSGSSSFFDNLADNAIDNMVALSFSLTAEKVN